MHIFSVTSICELEDIKGLLSIEIEIQAKDQCKYRSIVNKLHSSAFGNASSLQNDVIKNLFERHRDFSKNVVNRGIYKTEGTVYIFPLSLTIVN